MGIVSLHFFSIAGIPIEMAVSRGKGIQILVSVSGGVEEQNVKIEKGR